MIAGATAKMAAIVAWEYILVLWKMFQWRYDKGRRGKWARKNIYARWRSSRLFSHPSLLPKLLEPAKLLLHRVHRVRRS